MKIILYVLPRLLAVLITAFWCVNVFLSYGLTQTAIIKSGSWVALLLMTILSWKENQIGKISFIVLGIAYLIVSRGNFFLATRLLISAPLIITGILFLLSKKEYYSVLKQLWLKKTKAALKDNSDDRGII